jgi:hypothetical protein
MPDDTEAGLDPKAKEILEFLRANPGKTYTVMDLYGYVYSEAEKSAHRDVAGGAGETFRQIQGWINEFCELGHVRSKRIAASIFYTVDE